MKCIGRIIVEINKEKFEELQSILKSRHFKFEMKFEGEKERFTPPLTGDMESIRCEFPMRGEIEAAEKFEKIVKIMKEIGLKEPFIDKVTDEDNYY